MHRESPAEEIRYDTRRRRRAIINENSWIGFDVLAVTVIHNIRCNEFKLNWIPKLLKKPLNSRDIEWSECERRFRQLQFTSRIGISWKPPESLCYPGARTRASVLEWTCERNPWTVLAYLDYWANHSGLSRSERRKKETQKCLPKISISRRTAPPRRTTTWMCPRLSWSSRWEGGEGTPQSCDPGVELQIFWDPRPLDIILQYESY